MRKLRALALAAALTLTLTAAACPNSDRDKPGDPVCVDVQGDKEDCPSDWTEDLDWQ